MTDVEAKLQRFEQQLQQFAKDLGVLQRLNSINDTNTQLNKIPTLTGSPASSSIKTLKTPLL